MGGRRRSPSAIRENPWPRHLQLISLLLGVWEPLTVRAAAALVPPIDLPHS